MHSTGAPFTHSFLALVGMYTALVIPNEETEFPPQSLIVFTSGGWSVIFGYFASGIVGVIDGIPGTSALGTTRKSTSGAIPPRKP